MADSPLAGRHALITGGGTGIGAAAAAHLNGAGTKLSLLGRRIEQLMGPLGAALGVGAIGVAVVMVRFIRRHEKRLQAEAERMLPGPLA